VGSDVQVQQVTIHADGLEEDLQKEKAAKAEVEQSLQEESGKSQVGTDLW
jgi:hypothetical protein